ncbi:hypothetical protein QE152_g13931 [Popillia japonica]|uniref:Uncharacterized protein n=1 Tax=Popillia japonica TaxID=7064 RepID=A0AAW1L843_POPJA
MGNNLSICLCPKSESKLEIVDVDLQHLTNCIDEATTLEASNKYFEALKKYEEVVQILDTILNLNQTQEVEQCKLKMVHSEILGKINRLQAKHNDETSLVIYNKLINELRGFATDDVLLELNSIIYSNSQAELYYLSAEGNVTLKEGCQQLNILKSKGHTLNIFLQVGDWLYPLKPNVSPWYKSDYNGFFFPNIHSDDQGTSIGLIVPKGEDEVLHELLINLLYPEQNPSPGTTKPLFLGNAAGSGYVSTGLVYGVENLRKLLTVEIRNSNSIASEKDQLSSSITHDLKCTANDNNTEAIKSASKYTCF